MRGITQVPARHVYELRVTLRSPDRGEMADRPDDEAGDPETQAEADGAGERTIGDGDRTRCAAEQDRLGQRAMERCEEAADVLFHQTSAPPPKEKKERKKELAAKAIDSPNTICTSRRKPPAVSPNASVRPVTMMMITAMILATGPSMDSRMRCSGSSHGMPEPAAWAVVAKSIADVAARLSVRARRLADARET